MPEIPAPLKAALSERYEIKDEIGRGGMATVYLAHDLRHKCDVALKVPFADLSPTDGVDRFLREIRITAGLRHPFILPLHDSGEAAGFLYYVMPFVDSDTLRDRLNYQSPLPLERALKIAEEVAEALSYAHRNNVIHRDIKPENIFLIEGHAVLADFGISRAIQGGKRLTRPGVVVGTPWYMSPEQAEGKKGIDERSDLYSLGCVLFEMLAGVPPYTGPTIDTVIHQHIKARIPNIRKLQPNVPASLAKKLKRLLAKSPDKRYANAEEVSREVSHETLELKYAQ